MRYTNDRHSIFLQATRLPEETSPFHFVLGIGNRIKIVGAA